MEKKELPEMECLRSQVSSLYDEVLDYRSPQCFGRMMNLVVRNSQMSVLNAYLVLFQMPNAYIVMSPYRWRNLCHRQPKKGARPIATFFPFGPVEFLYEVGDTEPIPEMENRPAYEGGSREFMPSADDMERIEHYANPFSFNGDKAVVDVLLERVARSLPFHGIALDFNVRAGSCTGGYICVESKPIDISVPNGWDRRDSRFVIHINRNADDSAQLSSICHELGHFFCRHLTFDYAKDQCRDNLTKRQCEFEAETVAAIVLERYGLKTPSAEYLHAYIDENGLLPEVNIDVISSAVSKIQATLNGEVTCKTGDLYRNDADFAAFIDSI